MSKGRNLTKRKWRNGQRKKGNVHSRGRRNPESYMKFPRTSKFLRFFDGFRISHWKLWDVVRELEYMKY